MAAPFTTEVAPDDRHPSRPPRRHGPDLRAAGDHRHVVEGSPRHPVPRPPRRRTPPRARTRGRVARSRRYLDLHPRAAGPRPSGPGDLVPAPLHRRAERRHAPPPAGRAHEGPGGSHRQLQRRARRRGQGRHQGSGDPRAPEGSAHPADDHGASHRGKARDRAGEIPAHLPRPAGTRTAALDRARAQRPHERITRPDRARLDDGRIASGEGHCRARGRLGIALLRRDVVRDAARGRIFPRGIARRVLPGREVRGAGLLPVRLLDRRRPRRQPLRHRLGHPHDPAAQRARLAGAIS